MFTKVKKFFKKSLKNIKKGVTTMLGRTLDIFTLAHMLLCLIPGFDNQTAKFVLWSSFFVHLALKIRFKKKEVFNKGKLNQLLAFINKK